MLYSNWFKNETSLTLEANSEAYSEPCQTSKIEVFAQIVNGFEEGVRLTKWHQYTLSVSLKFGACYNTGQCGEFIKKMLLNGFMYFFGIFSFFIRKFVFSIFISFYDKVSNFRKRILTNQKRELVVSNCQRNCMLVIDYFCKKLHLRCLTGF